MTFVDLMAIEWHLADIRHEIGRRLPVRLSKDHDRIDIDAKGMKGADARALVDQLAQWFGRKGYLWDVWMNTASGDYSQVIHVAEVEKES